MFGSYYNSKIFIGLKNESLGLFAYLDILSMQYLYVSWVCTQMYVQVPI